MMIMMQIKEMSKAINGDVPEVHRDLIKDKDGYCAFNDEAADFLKGCKDGVYENKDCNLRIVPVYILTAGKNRYVYLQPREVVRTDKDGNPLIPEGRFTSKTKEDGSYVKLSSMI